MPVIGEWGTYIHIPKTGGTFVTQVLLKIGPRDGSQNLRTHDLPTYWRNEREIWTCVREPAEWLASVWAHRERTGWRRYPHQVPWHYLCDIFTEYKHNWNNFIEMVTSEIPGIVGWFYGIHTPPWVNAYKLGPELYNHLRSLGGNPDELGVKVNSGSNVPEVTEEQRIMVYNAEKAVYDRFDFPNPTL